MPQRISTQRLIEKIAPHNNQYRDSNTSNREKIVAMWKIGDALMEAGVTSAHSFGWEVQRATKGLIKRPTIFRSFKVRTIWPNVDALTKDIGNISGLGNFTEMLPIVDPAQDVRGKLTEKELKEVFQRACNDNSSSFKRFVESIKKRYACGRLGKRLDRSRHLGDAQEAAKAFRGFLTELLKMVDEKQKDARDKFRQEFVESDIRSFANMCIALTTKDNIRLFRKEGADISTSGTEIFRGLYHNFRDLLIKTSDVERARLRRVLSATELAAMSDLLSSLVSEDSMDDYRERKKISFQL